jgi:polyhydroxybutyrate depolymerase
MHIHFAKKTIIALLLTYSLDQAVFATTITPETITRPEGQRHYLLATPNHSEGKHPLIILLHGHMGSAAQLFGQDRTKAPLSVWLQIADREGLLIAAPDGLKGSDGKKGWNDCRSDADNDPKSDDVGLINAIIKREINEHNADPSRIFVMGMSNGAMMTFRVAIELGNQLAGFATVSGSMASLSSCPQPTVPLSALIISGTSDPLVPYTGGNVHFMTSTSRGGIIGIEQSTSIWRNLDQLPSSPTSISKLPHLDAEDPTSATLTIWGNNPKDLQVELLRIENGGHMEPSMSQRARRFYTMIVGKQNGDVEIAEEAWAFFKDKRQGLK